MTANKKVKSKQYMKVYRDISEIEPHRKSVVSVGTFDGFHLGHQSILQKIKAIAATNRLISAIVTFDPHPKKVLGNNSAGDLSILTTTEEKLRIFREAQIDQVLVIPFTREFASTPPREFVRDILVEKLAVKEMVIGHDHHFGRNRQGGLEELQQLGKELKFAVYQVPGFSLNGELISSSLIRKLLEAGEAEKAARYMGRPYSLFGVVVKGNGRGKQMGFPTANIALQHEDKLVPPPGVYAVDVVMEKLFYKGMMNIGTRPTFEFDSLTLEVHIFNFDAQIYGKPLEVRFKKFIRPERKFSGMEALREQLLNDKQVCENI